MAKSNKPAAASKRRKPVRRTGLDLVINRRREKRLDLPLSAVVEGCSPDGTPFSEKTTLDNISSTGAFFFLDAAIVIGSKIKLLIDLPKKLTENKSAQLELGGVVTRLAKPDSTSKKQGVALRFMRTVRYFNTGENR
jgi:c-di-GMP-binding flagellar brake protein YcgR